MNSPRDQRFYEPQTPEQVMREFPGWSVHRGTDRLWYARCEDSSAVAGEDLMDLRDQIIVWLRVHQL